MVLTVSQDILKTCYKLRKYLLTDTLNCYSDMHLSVMEGHGNTLVLSIADKNNQSKEADNKLAIKYYK